VGVHRRGPAGEARSHGQGGAGRGRRGWDGGKEVAAIAGPAAPGPRGVARGIPRRVTCSVSGRVALAAAELFLGAAYLGFQPLALGLEAAHVRFEAAPVGFEALLRRAVQLHLPAAPNSGPFRFARLVGRRPGRVDERVNGARLWGSRLLRRRRHCCRCRGERLRRLVLRRRGSRTAQRRRTRHRQYALSESLPESHGRLLLAEIWSARLVQRPQRPPARRGRAGRPRLGLGSAR
jgi:hypothetical protein